MKSKQDWAQIREEMKPDSKILVADNNSISSNNTENPEIGTSLPVLPYYSVNFSDYPHIVLIIGGETEGISQDSFQLASEKNGVRLNVPLSNKVDSLNTGTALGVIAFEIKRQLLMQNKV